MGGRRTNRSWVSAARDPRALQGGAKARCAMQRQPEVPPLISIRNPAVASWT